MSYTITLTDDEYAALASAAAERGQPIEALVHEALTARFPRSGDQVPHRTDPLIAYMLLAGHVRQAPTGTADTPDERAERRRLAESVGPGKMASEMALDDRGPR